MFLWKKGIPDPPFSQRERFRRLRPALLEHGARSSCKNLLGGALCAPGEEVCISYVDPNASVLDRRAILLDHYEFECRCARCSKEFREYLKAKARNRGQEYLKNKSKLVRNAYLHGMGGGGSTGTSSSVKR